MKVIAGIGVRCVTCRGWVSRGCPHCRGCPDPAVTLEQIVRGIVGVDRAVREKAA